MKDWQFESLGDGKERKKKKRQGYEILVALLLSRSVLAAAEIIAPV